jgi:hypothetical protein
MMNDIIKISVKIIVFIIIAIYFAGYVPIRKAHWVIHRVGYYTDLHDQTKRVACHEITPGDFGIPMLALCFSLVQSVTAYVYRPIAFIEEKVWYILVPAGYFWPYN